MHKINKEFTMNKLEERVKVELTHLLNECLAFENQENSFKVTGIDVHAGVFSVDFDIHIVEDDDYIGFTGY